jgi:hypothetical protein
LGRELSRFELFLFASLVLLLAWFVLERADGLAAAMEKVKLSTTVSQLQTAVQLVAAARVINGDRAALAALEGANPMQFGEAEPAGNRLRPVLPAANSLLADTHSYLGELDNPDPRHIAGGKWYYDRQAGVLVYRVENEAYFSTPLIGPKRARFRVMMDYDDLNDNGRYDADTERLTWARLEPLERYSWQD